MTRITAFILLLAVYLIVNQYPFGHLTGVQGEMVLALGFVILGGYLLGEILAAFSFPRITGYLLAGMVLGPDVTAVISDESVDSLQLIDQIALALIALTAGGELRLSSLAQQWRSLTVISLSHTLFHVVLGSLAFLLLVAYLPFLQGFDYSATLSAALIFGVIAISLSPATAVAIITETRAKGPATDVALGVSIIIDIIVIILFTIVITGIQTLTTDSQAGWQPFMMLFNKVFVSVAVGIAAGWIISLYLKHVQREPILFILSFSYLVSVGAKSFYMDPVILCVAAGIWVTNASKKGEELIQMIEQGSLLVYVIFFCVAGAALDLNALQSMWLLAVLLVVARMVIMALSTRAALWMSDFAMPSPWTYWLAFMPQAGVSLGLVAILAQQQFAWSADVQTLIIATIAINQLFGPIGMKYALQRSGETQEARKKAIRESAPAES